MHVCADTFLKIKNSNLSRSPILTITIVDQMSNALVSGAGLGGARAAPRVRVLK
jgi:hypothetical protein